MDEMDYPSENVSCDVEGPDSDVQLLHLSSLEINGISDKHKNCENEWWEV